MQFGLSAIPLWKREGSARNEHLKSCQQKTASHAGATGAPCAIRTTRAQTIKRCRGSLRRLRVFVLPVGVSCRPLRLFVPLPPRGRVPSIGERAQGNGLFVHYRLHHRADDTSG
jgi:hypothetical protein